MNKNNHANLYCGNCGKIGHVYRKCLEPITSLGVIVFRKNNEGNLEYLMIRRRNTLGFVEFIRGKYNFTNYKYLYQIFSIMTSKERELVTTYDFDQLWDLLWLNKHSKQYQNEYNNSKKKFNTLKNGIEIFDKKITLKSINEDSIKLYENPEWGFPKGRRNLKERDRECAIREFSEETGLTADDYNIQEKIPTFCETFNGTNNIRYKHIYYIAKWNSDKQVKVDPNNFSQLSEISDIRWFNIKDAVESIRTYNKEKRDMIKSVDKYLVSNRY
jgi:8-oxo-dGTP pyrophosphatase MutT (NUDIX family)